MLNKLKLCIVCLLLLFYNCKNKLNNKVNNKVNNDIVDLQSDCLIPSEIQNYLNKNFDKWSIIGLNDFDKELVVFLKEQRLYDLKEQETINCPYLIYGDFNHNEEKDLAIIVLSKNNNNFASLLIFNDYENNFSSPYVVSREGIYKNGIIKSVIYSLKEHGILAHLDKGDFCGLNVVNIHYFQKSGFFVYWDKEKMNYHFSHPKDFLYHNALSYIKQPCIECFEKETCDEWEKEKKQKALQEVIKQKVKSLTTTQHFSKKWQGNYHYLDVEGYTAGGDWTGHYTEYKITKDSVHLTTSGRMSGREDYYLAEEKGDTLLLYRYQMLTGDKSLYKNIELEKLYKKGTTYYFLVDGEEKKGVKLD